VRNSVEQYFDNSVIKKALKVVTMKHSCEKFANTAVGVAARRIVGANVRSIRKTHGWSQVELAKQVGVGQGAISAIERGARGPSLPMLFLLAQACEVQTERLVRWPGGADAAAISAEDR
jgi:DNA-binding XRE family transcriptional regulator